MDRVQHNVQELSRSSNARREALVLIVLVSAVLMLLWSGTSFFHDVRIATRFDRDIQLAGTALTLNVALILFGWRRYADLQFEAERQAENAKRAATLASTDPVTGLLNRKGFADRAGEIANTATSADKRLVIVSVHIQRFKTVNDQHGFEMGDRLLRAIASGLLDEFGPDAVVARLSGDEFAGAMLVEESDVEHSELVADNALRAATKPFMLDDRIIQVGAFCGLAAGAPDTGIPDLLRRADIAMDRARSGRIARPVWFDAGMERALIAQSEVEQGIRYGLDHNQFEPVFEPQFDLATGEVVGFEVLARWSHPLSGTILPDVFIPVAEEIGLIGRLSEQVIGSALTAAAGWDPRVKISVNISPVQLTDSWLAQKIVRILSETGFPAERLVIEITESSLFADLELARAIVTSLKNQGIRVALDDFGTGFSSLSHLRSLPFDIIKIDRSFVASLHEKRESMAIVRAVTTLAGALSVPVCIEGIENELAHRTVLEYGCAVGQGWYLGKPMPAEQARDLLLARERQDSAAPEASLGSAARR